MTAAFRAASFAFASFEPASIGVGLFDAAMFKSPHPPLAAAVESARVPVGISPVPEWTKLERPPDGTERMLRVSPGRPTTLGTADSRVAHRFVTIRVAELSIVCVPMPTQRALPDLEGVEPRPTSTSRGLRMHVAVAGPADAEPLVLLHGWPQHWYAWRRLIGPLSEHYRVYCPDLRGFGWTDAPAGSYEKASSPPTSSRCSTRSGSSGSGSPGTTGAASPGSWSASRPPSGSPTSPPPG